MMSLSNIRSIPPGDGKVLVGEYCIDRKAEEEAQAILATSYPDVKLFTTPEGKKVIPLQQLLILENRFQSEKKTIYEQRYKEGREEGYSAGHAAGLEEGQKDAREVVASLSGLLRDVTRQRHTLLEEAKQKILEMVLKISSKLTFTAAAVDPEITMSIISGAIDQLLDKKKIKAKVNPDHLPEIEQHIDNFRGRDTVIKEFKLEADPRVRKGGCFIETSSGDIDARLESMYEVIKQAILGGEDAVS
jgi:flagellar assembly protein FliH